MAENPKFNNSGMFTNVNDSTHNNISVDNKSEVLATQGNVINSIKTFWNNLRAKLKYAVTRVNTNNAVGGDYQPIYVNSNGEVAVCTPTFYSRTITNGKIDLPNEFPLYSGQIVCINVSSSTGNSNNTTLKIKDVPVCYPTNVPVKGSDINNGIYMFSYIGGNDNKWILNNKINVVSTDNPGLMTPTQYNKLKGIDDNANYYELEAATADKLGGVKLGYTTNGKNYKVQKDSSNNLYVNVPWTDEDTHYTALLRAGDNSSNDNGSTGNTNTYLKIVEDEDVTSNLKLVGSGGTTISSAQGIITINSPTVPSYNVLTSNNSDSSKFYIIKGAGIGKTNDSYFLAGNGNWVRVIQVPSPPSNIESEKTLKCKVDGTIYWG